MGGNRTLATLGQHASYLALVVTQDGAIDTIDPFVMLKAGRQRRLRVYHASICGGPNQPAASVEVDEGHRSELGYQYLMSGLERGHNCGHFNAHVDDPDTRPPRPNAVHVAHHYGRFGEGPAESDAPVILNHLGQRWVES